MYIPIACDTFPLIHKPCHHNLFQDNLIVFDIECSSFPLEWLQSCHSSVELNQLQKVPNCSHQLLRQLFPE